jgi:Kef-type K+ transport system membrane component KefB/mannitol/fructose-specific phosphotransferase system IIA component (Ntr-type)
MTEEHIGVFLIQVFLLLSLARVVGEALRKRGLPALVGEIAVGLFLGPTLLGRAFPELQRTLFPQETIQLAMLDTVSWFGVFFLLLETGLHIDISAAWRQRGPALRVGVIGVLVPLTIGTGLSVLLPDSYLAAPGTRIPFALFLGTAFAISAMVIIARVLHDLDLVKTDLGLVTLCGYAVNDILAWVILSVVLGLASPAGVSWGTVGFAVFFSVGFTAFCLTWGTRISGRVVAHVSAGEQPGMVLSLVAAIGLACGALTHAAGLTALFGFFIAGVMVGDAEALTERTRNVVSQMVHAVFVPLYFAGIGLRYDFLVEFDWFIVAFVTVVSIGAKFLGAWLGAWGTPLSRTDRVSIGIAFTPSGMTGIVVADIALEYGILTAPFFIGIVVSAIVSSLLVGPLLSWSTRREERVKPLDFFQWPATQVDLKGETRWEIIDEMCGLIETSGAGHVTAKSITEAVRAREELAGTGVGDQVAFPHARMAGLERPILTFGRSVKGVDWDAPDGVPVHLVFLVLTPGGDYGTQLMIMAALSKTLSQADVRERLLHADSEGELRAVLRGILEVPERMLGGGT